MTDETAGFSLTLASQISLVLSSPPSNIYSRLRSRARARSLTCTRIPRGGRSFLSFVTANSRLPSSRSPHPLPCRTFGSSSSSSSFDGSSFLQTVRLKRFDTVFDGCFNRSFKQSLWTRTLLLSLFLLAFFLVFLLLCPFVFVPFSPAETMHHFR